MNAAIKRITIASGLIALALLLGSCAKDPQKAKAKYLASGQNYMKKGKYGDAAVEFRNALRLDPRFVDAYYQLAQAYEAQHDWRGAFGSLEKAIDFDPNRLDARIDRGHLYLAARQFDKAQEDANFILTQHPDDAAANQLLGAALIGQGKPNEALAAFSKVTELRANDPNAFVNLALVEISLRRFAAAEQHLEKAMTIDPKFTQAYINLATCYQLQDRTAEALQVLQDGVTRNPDATLLYIDWASMLASQGRKDDAKAILDKLRKQLPNSADASIMIGDFYQEQKAATEALLEYQRGLSLSPKNVNIKKRIEDLYLSTGQTQPAAELDRELMKDAPKDTIVRIHHGRLLMAQQKPGDAIVFLQKVVADAADSPQAHYYLAMAYWQNGDTAQAKGALLDALKVDPGSPVTLQGLARLSLLQNDPVEAQHYAQELIHKFPADPADRLLLADALVRQGYVRQAEEQILIAKQLTPNDPAVHLSLARLYSAEKKWPEAQKEFETVFQLDPHNTSALEEFAIFLKARNQSAEAFLRVQQYVNANPNDVNGHLILCRLNFESKNYSSAQAECERAIQLDPTFVQAYLGLGKVLEAEGQTDLAIARFQKALELQPRSAVIPTEIGNLYLDRNDLETARKYYQKALEVDPNYAVAMANIAWVDASEGRDLDVALGLAQKAKLEMPEVPSITDTLGWVMYKRGNYSSAIPLLQECVQKAPNLAVYHYHLGMVLLAAGKKEEGDAQLQAALHMKQLRPTDSEQARQALARNR